MRSSSHLWHRLAVPAILRGSVALAALALAGCAALMTPQQATVQAERMAAEAGLMPLSLPAAPFRLRGFGRGIDGEAAVVHVYIEGDGRAWRGRRRPPRDPTPVDPVALRLAARDPVANLAYLARPCQFVTVAPPCRTAHWTAARYSEDAVAALDAALDRLQSGARQRRLLLIGHSGGGVMATLLAARRDDVAGVVTLASPLSVATWTQALSLSPLRESLDPARLPTAALERLAALPQRHYIGDADPVVPMASPRAYLDALPDPERASLVILRGVDHRCCWSERWPDLLDRTAAEVPGWPPLRDGQDP